MRDQVRDAMRDDPRFTAAGPGQHEKRALDVLDGLPLLGIQTRKKVHLGRISINFTMRLRELTKDGAIVVT